MFRNKIVRADGTTEVLGIKQGSFHYHSQMETTGKIQVGNVISAFVEFSFYVDVNGGAIPVGEQIQYYQVTDVNSDFVETSTISENLIGTFNVTLSNTNKNICTIVAYDNISKLNVDYSLRLKEIQNQFPMRIRDLLDEAANYVGLTSNVGHYSRVDILYTGMLPEFYSDGITVRDLFAWAGVLVGCAIYANASGNIYQREYDAKYNGQPWKYSNRYIISPTDQEEYYTPDGTIQLTPLFYEQDSFYSDEYSVVPYDCVEVYKSDGSLFATYSPSGSTNSKKYVVFGNVFLDFVDTQALSTQANLVASDIYEYLSGSVLHSPMRVSLFPFRYPYGYGSGSITYLYDITGEVVSIPIMSLDLTDESVIIEVFGEDEENGKHRQDFTADERATNLSAQINAIRNDVGSALVDIETIQSAINSAHIYFTPSELGLSGTPTMKAVVDAMPNYSIGCFDNNRIDQSALTQPFGDSVNVVVIFKYGQYRTFAVGARAYNNVSDTAARYAFASYNGSAWKGWYAIVKEQELRYQTNDTYVSTKSHLLYGIITGGSTNFVCDVVLPKTLENITGVTVTAMTGIIRGVLGNVDNPSQNVNLLASPYSATAEKLDYNKIRITVHKNSAYTNTTNNSPATYWGSISLKFT